MAAGAFGMWAGGQVGGQEQPLDEYTDLSDYVQAQLEAGSQDSTGGAITVGGGIVLFLGLFAFVRSFAGEPEGPGGPGLDAADLLAAAGLSADDVSPELLAAAGLRVDTLPARPAPEARGAPLAGPDGGVPFDPTFWTHPAAVLYLFEQRPATSFYELIKELRDREVRGQGLLVALLQSLGPARGKVVAVLGTDDAVRAFDRRFQADIGARVDRGEIDWLRLRPDLQLQKESYDDRYVLEDNSAYRELRAALRRAEYMVLAADAG